MKNNNFFVGLAVAVAIIGGGVLWNGGSMKPQKDPKTEKYSKLRLEDSISAVVTGKYVNRDDYFSLSDSSFCFFETTYNNYYEFPNNDLASMLSTGDSIIKKPYNDTIIVMKQNSGEKYLFKHGYTINSKLE